MSPPSERKSGGGVAGGWNFVFQVLSQVNYKFQLSNSLYLSKGRDLGNGKEGDNFLLSQQMSDIKLIVHMKLKCKGLASHCKAKTTFAFHFSIINA